MKQNKAGVGVRMRTPTPAFLFGAYSGALNSGFAIGLPPM